MLVHLGIVLIAAAVIGNEFFQQNTNVTLGNGESVTLAATNRLHWAGAEPQGEPCRIPRRLMIFDQESGKTLGSILPRRNIYDKTPEQPTSEVGRA